MEPKEMPFAAPGVAVVEKVPVQSPDPGLLPPYFGVMLLALVIVSAIAGVLMLAGWRVIDWLTPGQLNEEILGTKDKAPNLALAVVAAAMILAFGVILGCTVIGVLVH